MEIVYYFDGRQTVIQEMVGFVLMIKLQSIFNFSIIHNWKRYCCDLFFYLNTITFLTTTERKRNKKTSSLDSLALVVFLFFTFQLPRTDLLSSYHRCWTLNLIKLFFFYFCAQFSYFFEDH